MSDEVQHIKDRLNIVDVVGQYVTLRKAGRTYMARCPFHKEKTPSFHVSPERGTYKCFGCGEGGDIFTFVEKMEGIEFGAALKQLADKAGVKLTPRSSNQPNPHEKEHEERLREVCEAATLFFESKLKEKKEVRNYLHTRGVVDETVAHWRLGYAPAEWRQLSGYLQTCSFSKQEIVDAGLAIRSEKREGEIYDRFRGRIMFPMFDAVGKVIAFSGRFFEAILSADGTPREEGAKYVNSPETGLFKKSRTLYGFDRAKNYIRKLDCILLVEGQFDLILCHQSGLPYTVALSGTALTPEHLSLLSRLSKRLVLALDADAAGISAGLKSARMAYAAGFDVKVPTFLTGQDPADIARDNPELLKAAIRTSKTAVEFFLDVLRPGVRDERTYKRMVEVQVLPLVSALGSQIEKEHFIEIIARRLGVSEASVRYEVHKRVTVPATPQVSESLSKNDAAVDPFKRKIGMLIFYFGSESLLYERLIDLLGKERVKEIERELEPQAEALRFGFEREVGEHTTQEVIAGDMLADIERVVGKERLKMKFLG